MQERSCEKNKRRTSQIAFCGPKSCAGDADPFVSLSNLAGRWTLLFQSPSLTPALGDTSHPAPRRRRALGLPAAGPSPPPSREPRGPPVRARRHLSAPAGCSTARAAAPCRCTPAAAAGAGGRAGAAAQDPSRGGSQAVPGGPRPGLSPAERSGALFLPERTPLG